MAPASKMDLGAVASAVVGVASVIASVAWIALFAPGKPLDGAHLASGVSSMGFGIVAIFLGILALRRIRRDPELRRGKVLAVVGVVLGSLVILTLL